MLEPDLDAIEALSDERESLWRRVSAADFLTADEKREAVGYGRRPERAFGRKYRPDQPRMPRGNPGGGQFTDGNGDAAISPKPGAEEADRPRDEARIMLAGGFSKEQLNLTVDDFVAQNCQGRIRRELPGEFYGSTVGEVMAQADSGSTSAKKCLKLLKQDRFRK